MNKFRKRSYTVEATQWFMNGDHPLDYFRTYTAVVDGKMHEYSPEERKLRGWEGDVVRYFRHPDFPGDSLCKQCGHTINAHGWIDSQESGHVVCPGDWVVTQEPGVFYPVKPRVFNNAFIPVNKDEKLREDQLTSWLEIIEEMCNSGASLEDIHDTVNKALTETEELKE